MRFLPGLRTAGRPRRIEAPALPGMDAEEKVVLASYYDTLAAAGIGVGRDDTSTAWDVQQAVIKGYCRVVYVFKAVEAISGNSARLPFRLKQDEDVLDDHPLYRLLNHGKANPLESGRQFRKRLSAQVMLSKRGAFVETTKSVGGDPVRLDLLPPARTRPVPGSGADLISHYEVTLRDGGVRRIDPDRVRWVREPHPLDPFSGVTPLEAAGMSIELDFFARLYNVQFMRNDGRPGGILGVEGDMEEMDMDRLESRFGKGPVEAGKLSVVSGQLSYVDTARTPRDSSYQVASRNARDEIVVAFGTPLSQMGDASGKTFANADSEGYVFWTQTMAQHNDLIAAAFDEDSEDDLTGFLDTESIEVLQRSKIARRDEMRTEVGAGLRSIWSYAHETDIDVDSTPQTRALWIPAGKTPVAATEADQEVLGQAPPATGGKPGGPPADDDGDDGDDGTGGGGPGGGGAPDAPATPRGAPTTTEGLPRVPESGGNVVPLRPVAVKHRIAVETKAASAGPTSEVPDGDFTRIETKVGAALDALAARQAEVVAARLASPKARKGTRHWSPTGPEDRRGGTKAINAARIVDPKKWGAEAETALRPIVEAGTEAVAASMVADLGLGETKAWDPALHPRDDRGRWSSHARSTLRKLMSAVPAMPFPPAVNFVDRGSPTMIAQFDMLNNTLNVSESPAHEETVRAGGTTGAYTPDAATDPVGHVIAHELGHAVALRLPLGNKQRMFARIAALLGLPADGGYLAGQDIHDAAGADLIAREVSRYGASDPAEWFPEAFAEGMLSDRPRPVAAIVGEEVRAAWGPDGDAFDLPPPAVPDWLARLGLDTKASRVLAEKDRKAAADAAAEALWVARTSVVKHSERLAEIIQDREDDGASVEQIVAAVKDYAAQFRRGWSQVVATQVAQVVIEGTRTRIGNLPRSQRDIMRAWVTKGDEKVRPSHRAANGQKRRAGQPFSIDGATVRYPGDPLAPHHVSKNCRCRLVYTSRATRRFTPTPPGETARNPALARKVLTWALLPMVVPRPMMAVAGLDGKVVRHVRTPGGVERFDQPIGSVIVRDVVPHVTLQTRTASPPSERVTKARKWSDTSGITDWETTKPWERSIEDIRAGKVAGIRYRRDAVRGFTAQWAGDHIEVNETYGAMGDPETLRALLYHEAGHAPASEVIARGDIGPLLDPFRRDGSRQFRSPFGSSVDSLHGHSDEAAEILADAYMMLATGRGGVYGDAPGVAAVYEQIESAARKLGFPLRDRRETPPPPTWDEWRSEGESRWVRRPDGDYVVVTREGRGKWAWSGYSGEYGSMGTASTRAAAEQASEDARLRARSRAETKTVRHVRTPEGQRRFDQPIGSVIVRDVPGSVRGRARGAPLAVTLARTVMVNTVPAAILPPAPGTASIPEGHLRLWHYTGAPAQTIRTEGLLEGHARGDGGLGAGNEDSAGVWASTRAPDSESLSRANYVEFHAHPDEISGRADSLWRVTAGIDTLDQFQQGYNNVILNGDVKPSQIVVVHEPWHAHARFILDDPQMAQEVRDGAHDNLRDDPNLAPAIAYVKSQAEKPRLASVGVDTVATGAPPRLLDPAMRRARYGDTLKAVAASIEKIAPRARVHLDTAMTVDQATSVAQGMDDVVRRFPTIGNDVSNVDVSYMVNLNGADAQVDATPTGARVRVALGKVMQSAQGLVGAGGVRLREGPLGELSSVTSAAADTPEALGGRTASLVGVRGTPHPGGPEVGAASHRLLYGTIIHEMAHVVDVHGQLQQTLEAEDVTWVDEQWMNQSFVEGGVWPHIVTVGGPAARDVRARVPGATGLWETFFIDGAPSVYGQENPAEWTAEMLTADILDHYPRPVDPEVRERIREASARWASKMIDWSRAPSLELKAAMEAAGIRDSFGPGSVVWEWTAATPGGLDGKAVRHVRTPAGVEKYDQPVGSVIVADPVGGWSNVGGQLRATRGRVGLTVERDGGKWTWRVGTATAGNAGEADDEDAAKAAAETAAAKVAADIQSAADKRSAWKARTTVWLDPDDPDVGGLTGPEATAIRDYQTAGYHDVNGSLRSGTKPEYDDTPGIVAAMDAAVGRSRTPAPMTTYRGMYDRPPGLVVGAEFTDAGFGSTSVDEGYVRRIFAEGEDAVLMVIAVPEGASALELRSPEGVGAYMQEDEVLLPRGTRYRVVSEDAGGDGQPTVLHVEVLP